MFDLLKVFFAFPWTGLLSCECDCLLSVLALHPLHPGLLPPGPPRLLTQVSGQVVASEAGSALQVRPGCGRLSRECSNISFTSFGRFTTEN